MKIQKQKSVWGFTLLSIFSITFTSASELKLESMSQLSEHKIKYENNEYSTLRESKSIPTFSFSLTAKEKDLPFVKKISSTEAWQKFLDKKELNNTKDIDDNKFFQKREKVSEPNFSKYFAFVFYDERPNTSYINSESFETNGTVKCFSFYGYSWEKVPSLKGQYRVVLIPNQFLESKIELTLAYQSWGRECAVFSKTLKVKK